MYLSQIKPETYNHCFQNKLKRFILNHSNHSKNFNLEKMYLVILNFAHGYK